ncbi:hypothetical protein [Psychrobacter sp. ANT_WB68]|uniref:hypothetical protein n=1 Tax=Psychrobacter sp. ANT_WB68 TaxID=2597355 RepID=UPI0011F38C3C|nr:hypothetical protein [Psychrobacter sp. ANT_WB68]KAA0912815.1 hypothetical protein FQ084_12470 [Psychrobacter sp. ANT_WB68]
MKKLAFIFLISLTACRPFDDIDSDTDDYIGVSEVHWSSYGNVKPYPFTTSYGNIACSLNEVSFYPDDTANDELTIGFPLNKLAQIRQKTSGVTANVKNTIKRDADLSEAIRMGLDRCKQTEERLEKFKAQNSK